MRGVALQLLRAGHTWPPRRYTLRKQWLPTANSCTGEGRDRRDRRRMPRERLEGDDRPLSSTCASTTSGRRAHPRRGPRSARLPRVADREALPRQATVRSSSTAPAARAPRSPRRRSTSSATTNVVSLAGGFTDWKRNGFAVRRRRARSTADQRARYSRHLLIPEVGEEGQQKLLDCARAPDRRRRARLARVALPRRRRRRHARHRRRRRRRRLEPAAPDRPLDEPLGEPKVALREADDRGAQPRRRRSSPTRSASPPRTSSGSSATAGT